MNLKTLTFSLFIFFPQIWYFYPLLGFSALTLGFTIFLTLFFSKKINFIVSKFDFLIFSQFLIFFVSCILLSLLDNHSSENRFLFIYALMQLIMFLCIKDIKSNELKNIRLILILYFLIELLILSLQFIYVSYGFGLPPKNNFGIYAIGGSSGNPNNLAVVLSLVYIFIVLSKDDYFSNYKTTFIFMLLTVFYLLGIFITSSRTVLVVSLLFLFFYLLRRKISVLYIFLTIIIVISLTNLSILNSNNDVINRSITKIGSIQSFNEDSSANFRLLAFERLFENFTNLDLGTWQDRNYTKFFKDSDPELIKTNPHGFLPEVSFLFGFFGFIFGIFTIIVYIYGIFINNYLKRNLKFVLIVCFLFYMSVPSSILGLPIFFVLFYLILKVGSLNE